MPFHIRDPETDRLARELAKVKGIGLTEAVKLAVENELARMSAAQARRAAGTVERLARLRQEVLSRPSTGLTADKAFFDDLSGD
jgi:antitoxin VapB